jgi:hypothetical protein
MVDSWSQRPLHAPPKACSDGLLGAADNWNIPAENYTWVVDKYMANRAAIARRHGKPIIVEEFGARKVRSQPQFESESEP